MRSLVAAIVPENVEELGSKDQLTEHDGPFEALGRWLEHNDITGDKADRLKVLAEPIIKKAYDGRDDGKHTGAFIPHKIEVKNYRSYTEAEFDFSPVRMAMVNGQNGVGKSSLFMDATALPPIIGCKVCSQKPCSVPSSLKFNWFTLPQ